MNLIVAIMSEQHSQKTIGMLTRAGYRATLISKTGGFLRKGNATLLIGVEREKVNDVLNHIEVACADLPRAKSSRACANVFVLNVQSYEQV